MSLKSLIANERTDKDTTHSYINLYDKLLLKRKETAFNILEIGIYYGGSNNYGVIILQMQLYMV